MNVISGLFVSIPIFVTKPIIIFLYLNWQTGKLLQENDKEVGHKKTITSLAKSTDCSHFLTGSLDKSAKVFSSFIMVLIIETTFLMSHYFFKIFSYGTADR